MRTAWELPPWMRVDFSIRGAEGEGDDGDNDSGEDDSGDDDDDSGDEGGSTPDDKAELKAALEKERKFRRDAERRAKASDRKLADQERARNAQNQSDAEALTQVRKDLEESQARNKGLAEGFRTLALDRAIETAARNAKFLDPEDALLLVDRGMIEVEQDEDEPQKVVVDRDTVKKAVKKLADSKKHLLGTGTEDGGPTGSQFGNNGKGGKAPTAEEELRKRYPSLNY